MSRLLLLAGALALGGSLVAASTVAQDSKGGPPGLDALSGQLVAALKTSPGCLGVELGGFQSGKFAIFAWFQDKESLLTWYRSGVHQGAMASMRAGAAAAKKGAGGGVESKESKEPREPKEAAAPHAPLEFVPADVGTILCIATITPSEQPAVAGFPAPIGQISIELYQPLPGGASFGGTFTPLAVPLEHHRGSRVPQKGPPAAPSAPEKAGEKSGAKSGEKSGI
jgi:hypothetical protein